MALVQAPDGAKLIIKDSLHDAADESAAMVVTVHLIDEKCACNVWICKGEQWKRMIEERVLDQRNPTPDMLMGELYRLSSQRGRQIDNNFRLKLAVMGLMISVKNMVEDK